MLNELTADITYPLVDVHILIWPVVPDFDLVNGLVPAQVSSSGVRMTFLYKHEKSHLLHKCLSIPEVTYCFFTQTSQLFPSTFIPRTPSYIIVRVKSNRSFSFLSAERKTFLP